MFRFQPLSLAIAVALACVVSFVYSPVGGHGFINIDDGLYVFNNPHVSQGLTADSVRWAFTTFHASNWHPLTWISHMVDVSLFGMDPRAFHLVNVAYHLANTVILFLLLRAMTGRLWASAFCAALFGVHPLHVESVAWISERKDVLSSFFWLLSTAAYVRFVRRPSGGRYALVVAFFASGLMCKPMLVTLPFTLLLLDYWPLRRIDDPSSLLRRASEKAPLFLLSAISCVVTIQAQAGAMSDDRAIPISVRASNALVSVGAYLGKTVWPFALAIPYPHPATVGEAVPAWKFVGSVLLVAFILMAAAWMYRKRPPWTVGILWFLGTLVPVLGLVQVGTAAMADRYTYLPLIGIFVAIAWTFPERFGSEAVRRATSSVCVLVIALLTLAARSQAGYWRDSVTLLSHTMTVTERNTFAANNLATELSDRGRYPEALALLEDAARIRPDDPDTWYNLGTVLARMGRSGDAVGCFRNAVRLRPGYGAAWNSLGVALGRTGDYPQAVKAHREALRLDSDNVAAWRNLGMALMGLGRRGEAIDCFREVLRRRPDDEFARYAVGRGGL